MSTGRDPHRAAEAVWRLDSPKLVAVGVRLVRDVGLAEDFAQDALLAALERWPETGVPSNPAAWLTTVVKRRCVDHLRRAERLRVRENAIGEAALRGAMSSADTDPLDLDRIEDDLLRLLFISCHPAISPPSRVALTLRLLGGLTTAEIARAFLVPEATVAQRIVRAKRDLKDRRAEMDDPDGAERLRRLPSVMQTIYLIFNEGYSATAGDEWVRKSLCYEAVRLARLLHALLPDDTEVLGLLALVEIQSSRIEARTGPEGEPVLLDDQDRSRWDHSRIRRGLAALGRAEELGHEVGPYLIQAEIAACHARAVDPADTDWARIVAWYDLLQDATPSPLVALNRAVAVSRRDGAAEAVEIVESLVHGSLEVNHLAWATYAALLTDLGREEEARVANGRAAALASNTAEIGLLERRVSDGS